MNPQQRERAPKIDIHTHMLERRAAEAGIPENVVSGFGARPFTVGPGTAAEASVQKSYDPALHVAMLDDLGLDAELLSSTLVMQGASWATPDLEAELTAGVNDEIARWAREHPTRLIGAFTPPLQDEARTRDEVARCTSELGMRVLQLPVCVNGTYLSAPSYRYLWELIAELDLVAFMHPDGTRDPWFQQYSMWNSVGQPIEEAKFIASLIYEGVLEDLPQLKVIIAHGGGYLPQYFGRLDRNAKAWPGSMKNISRPPSEYLRNLYYDTCLYEPAMLEALIAHVGADRIVMGSDFPVGETDPVGFVERSTSLSAEDVERVTGTTAARLLGLVAADEPGVMDARAPHPDDPAT